MPRDRGSRIGSGSGAVAVLAVGLATVLVVLVGTLAASSGPTEVFAGDGPTPERISTTPPTETATAEPGGGDGPAPPVPELDDDTLSTVGRVIRALLGVLVVAALLLAVAAYLHRRPRRVASRVQLGGDDDLAVADPLPAVSAALVEDAEEQDAALQQGTPRNGIVAAWLRFEVQAARAGVPREQWETSTEFTVRLLAALHADADATRRLAELYRLARFSDHDLGDEERAAAADALRRLRTRLADRSGERRVGP
jgi:hypothetical protein